MKYIWQKNNWTHFYWDQDSIINPLLVARKKQGFIIGRGEFLNLKEEGELILEESLTTSAIEGEIMNRDEVRSSIAERLGLPRIKRNSDGLVEILMDATGNYLTPL
ncbi:MAG: DUF4172 domain-containing protein [Spirochaetales bacterium]|nr:DUF4172 domain-containing protein [Spirochaetales bacterium]